MNPRLPILLAVSSASLLACSASGTSATPATDSGPAATPHTQPSHGRDAGASSGSGSAPHDGGRSGSSGSGSGSSTPSTDGSVLADTGTDAGAPWGFSMDLCVDALEFGNVSVGNVGTANVTYGIPTASELDYYRSKGLMHIRLPFRWERVQPTASGPLDPAYLGYLTTLVKDAAARGMSVLLDVHNYGAYYGLKLGAGPDAGADAPTDADFADLWTKLATTFGTMPGVWGYDLMNEPSNMPSPGAWPAAAQAAVNAIRHVDAKTTIFVEGDFYASAQAWTSVNGSLNIDDPSKNLVYSAHTYFDRDSSGTHFVWSQEAEAGVTVDTGVQRLTVFVGWLQQHGFRGHTGEMGVGNDDPSWNVALDNALAYLKTNGVPATYFAAGPWWGSYPMSAEPLNGVDAKQMSVLVKYSE